MHKGDYLELLNVCILVGMVIVFFYAICFVSYA